MNSQEPLSRRERQIMDAVYACGQATVRQVAEAMPDAASVASIRATMLILQGKGHLKSRKAGRENVFAPTRPRKQAGRSALRRVVATFFGGSLEQAVAAHLSDPKARLSAQEVSRLAELIRRSAKKGSEIRGAQP